LHVLNYTKRLFNEKQVQTNCFYYNFPLKIEAKLISFLRSESNKRALRPLLTLVISAVVIFLIEKEFLVAELRGETVSRYEKIKWLDKILFLAEDFEGFKADSLSLQKSKFFSYGSAKITLDSLQPDDNLLASKACLKVEWNGKESYGGWGKGVGKNIDLNTLTDYLNFRVYVPKNNVHDEIITIRLEEDDNNDGILQQDKDDSFAYKLNIQVKDEWQFICIPLKDFIDTNTGGDNKLNITRKGGLHTIIFSLEQVQKYRGHHKWYFDFICFTSEKVSAL